MRRPLGSHGFRRRLHRRQAALADCHLGHPPRSTRRCPFSVHAVYRASPAGPAGRRAAPASAGSRTPCRCPPPGWDAACPKTRQSQGHGRRPPAPAGVRKSRARGRLQSADSTAPPVVPRRRAETKWFSLGASAAHALRAAAGAPRANHSGGSLVGMAPAGARATPAASAGPAWDTGQVAVVGMTCAPGSV